MRVEKASESDPAPRVSQKFKAYQRDSYALPVFPLFMLKRYE